MASRALLSCICFDVNDSTALEGMGKFPEIQTPTREGVPTLERITRRVAVYAPVGTQSNPCGLSGGGIVCLQAREVIWLSSAHERLQSPQTLDRAFRAAGASRKDYDHHDHCGTHGG